jgi:uncharacterized protein
MTDIIVSELRIHPIKGLKRTMLDVMDITTTGPLNDRRFMLIDENNQFLTQRTYPMLATIDVTVEGDEFSLVVPGETLLTFRSNDSESDLIEATIWKDTVTVVEISRKASKLVSDYMQTPCRLVGMAQNHNRLVSQKYSRTGSEEVLFADGFPFLLISQASLDELNGRLEAPVPMDRFRPNIVVTGCVPFQEDQWETIQIGDILFDLVKPCGRCIVTTIDQETGLKDTEKSKNPLKVLARYRNTENGILFGQNMIHRSTGSLTLGQSVTVVRKRESNFLTPLH